MSLDTNDYAVGVDIGFKGVILSDGTKLYGNIFAIARQIAKDYTLVCLETLSSDFKELSEKLACIEQVCRIRKVQCVRIDRYYPSTQTCFVCKALSGPKTLAIRKWTCYECGEEHDRDVNAARNIRARGLGMLQHA